MALLHYDNVEIAALAGAVPNFIQKVDCSPENPQASYISNFVKQTGILQRYISLTEQTASDLGYCALQAALNKAAWDAKSLDGLIFLTQTPDFNNATGNSFILHNHLNLRQDTLVFDIAQGCASFPYGLSVCASLLQQPNINRIAMISGDNCWHNYPSRDAILATSYFLTGEGTTAILLEKKISTPIDIALYSNGAGYCFLYEPGYGSRNTWRRGPGKLPNGQMYFGGTYMEGLEITSFATIQVVTTIKDFLKTLCKSVTDYEGVVLHQANMQIVKTMGRRLKVDPEKLPLTVDKMANTNGASVTLTIIDAYAGKKGPLKLLISAFGIGLSWGVVSLELDASVIVPLLKCNERFDEDFLQPVNE